jgi:hypothetical protein
MSNKHTNRSTGSAHLSDRLLFENQFQRFWNSETYRVTHRRIVEWATLIPHSAIVSTRSRYEAWAAF